MGKFNSDDHYIYYWEQESLRRNGVALIVKSPRCSAWVQSQKRQCDLCSFPKQTIQYHSNSSLCPTTNAEEVEDYLHDPDYHDGVTTHLEPDILECEVKWALESITAKLGEAMQFS